MAADTIEQQVNADPLSSLFQERSLHPPPDQVIMDDEELDQDDLLGATDRFEYSFEGRFAVYQQAYIIIRQARHATQTG